MDGPIVADVVEKLTELKAALFDVHAQLRAIEQRCDEWKAPETAWDIGREAYEWKLQSRGTDQQFADRIGEPVHRVAAARRCYQSYVIDAPHDRPLLKLPQLSWSHFNAVISNPHRAALLQWASTERKSVRQLRERMSEGVELRRVG